MRPFQVFSLYALEEIEHRALCARNATRSAERMTREAEEALEEATSEVNERGAAYTEAAESARFAAESAESAAIIGWLAILDREECSRRWRYSETRAGLAYQALRLKQQEERGARTHARRLEETLERLKHLEQAAEARDAAELPLSREAVRRESWPVGKGGTRELRRFMKKQRTRSNRRRNHAEALSLLGWGDS
jgi:hypothetical protein